jgi:Beta propeller domain
MMNDMTVPTSSKGDEEDPSVILTADDTSSTTGSDVNSSSSPKEASPVVLVKSKSKKMWLGSAVAAVLLVIVVVVVVTCSSLNNTKAMSTKSSNAEEATRKPCKKKNDGVLEDVPVIQEDETTTTNHGVVVDVVDEEEDLLPTELPFPNVTPLRGFSSQVLQGYATIQEFQDDLTLAAQHLLNQVILQNVARHQYQSHQAWSPEEEEEENSPRPSTTTTTVAQEAAVGIVTATAGTTTSTSSNSKTDKTTTQLSKTNNQEETADEADLVKNDGQFVYAAMGDHLLVYDSQTGHQITQIQMPPLDNDNDHQQQPQQQGFASNNDGSSPCYIHGLVLTPNHVVVVVDAYTPGGTPRDDVILSHYQGTQVRIYSKPTVSGGSSSTTEMMKLLATQSLSGSYRDGVWLEQSQTLHLVTSGDIDTYLPLVEPLSYHHFTTSSNSNNNSTLMEPMAYVRAATELATSTLIPNFVTALTEAFLINGKLPEMLQLNAWTSSPDDNTNDEDDGKSAIMTAHETLAFFAAGKERLYQTTANVPLRAFLQVISLHIDDLPAPDAITTVPVPEFLPFSVSLLLTPTTMANFYATNQDLVLAFTHYHEQQESFNNNDDNNATRISSIAATEQDLFVVHMAVETAVNDKEEQIDINNDMSKARALFHSVAMTPGQLKNRYSVDILGKDLRIATMLQKWNALDRMAELCTANFSDDDLCQNEDTWNQCFDLVYQGCTQLQTTGCPSVYTCANAEQEQYQEEESSTENHVIVYDLSEPGQMKERGRVRIGKAHQAITAMRFGETFSYATTFDRREHFYVLSLVPGQPPAVVGELELNGFSGYLHPLEDTNGQLLVGIGQNVTGRGLDQLNTAVMITLFNVSNPTNPKVVASLMLENDDTIASNTNAEWDPRSVQYANGKLILPVTMYHNGGWVEGEDDWFPQETNIDVDDFVEDQEQVSRGGTPATGKDFEGFFVLDVGTGGIREAFRVNHARSTEACHYCNVGLTNPRSILMDDGSLITMYDDAIQSTNMTTGETLWNLNVELEGVAKDCCW